MFFSSGEHDRGVEAPYLDALAAEVRAWQRGHGKSPGLTAVATPSGLALQDGRNGNDSEVRVLDAGDSAIVRACDDIAWPPGTS